MREQLWRGTKWISLGVSVASIVLAVVLILMSGPEEPEPVHTEEEKPKTQVESPVIVERKDGKVIWQLRASDASQQLDGQMLLTNPDLVLFSQQGHEVHITSQQAWFEPLKRNVRFQNDVLVTHEIWTMTTDTMIYLSGKDEIHVPGAFKVQGGSIKARGKNMRLHRTNEQVNVDGGIWIEDTKPQWQGVK